MNKVEIIRMAKGEAAVVIVDHFGCVYTCRITYVGGGEEDER